MRYYNIVITDPATGTVLPTAAATKSASYSYTSFINGQTLAAALNVELDIPVYTFAQPMGAAFVRVWGVSVQEIAQSSNLNGKNISVYGGFQKGYPLANPKQAGLLMQGQIFQAFGNWVGNEQSLDLIIYASVGTPQAPKNIVLDWLGGSTLSQVIQATLKTAFPGTTIAINISPNLVRSNDEPGYFQTLEQFASYIKQITTGVLGTDYLGVDISLKGNTFNVSDGTVQPQVKQVLYQDLIGQPTWIAPGVIQFKCPMRADLSVLDVVKMPPSIVTTSQASQSSLINLKTTFQGTFLVTVARHVGNYRQPDAASWVTTYNAAAQNLASVVGG